MNYAISITYSRNAPLVLLGPGVGQSKQLIIDLDRRRSHKSKSISSDAREHGHVENPVQSFFCFACAGRVNGNSGVGHKPLRGFI